MVIIKYDKDYAFSLPDGAIPNWIKKKVINSDKIFEVGQILIITYIRKMIIENIIDKDEIRIMIKNDVYSIDEFGCLNTWPLPKELLIIDDLYASIVQKQMEKRLKGVS